MQIGVIIADAQYTLLDPNAVYWSVNELIAYLNLGMASIVAVKPDANTITGAIPLVSGINQSIPAGGVQFLDAFINVASNNGILVRDLKKFTTANPAWAAAPQAVDVNYFFPDFRDPTRFRVSPPNNGSGSILGMYSAVPGPVANLTDPLPISDIYQDPLWAYVVAHALSKNTSKQDLPKAAQFFAFAAGLVTGKNQAQMAEAPKTELPDLTK